MASVALTVAFMGAATAGAPASSAYSVTPPPGYPITASAVGLPTWQVNGVVWGQAVVGNTVYVAGNFTKVRPAGAAVGSAQEIPQNHLMAYDIRTGERIASFDHQLNAQSFVVAASPDGSRIYVGGDFTTVDGQPRAHLAAFDAATGALVPGFTPAVDGTVKGLVATASTLYVGGAFQNSGVQGRRRLAAFSTADGSLLPWAPTADWGDVQSMVMAPDRTKIIVAGAFTTLSGQANSGTGAIDVKTGAILPWTMNKRIGTTSANGWAITSVSTDGTYVYGSGFNYQGNLNFEGTFAANPADGSLAWVNDCIGDSYDTAPLGGVLYVASHSHDCTAMGGFTDTSPRVNWEHATAFSTTPGAKNVKPDAYGWSFTDQPATTLLHFHPDLAVGNASGQYQASWTVEGNDDYVVYGGEFPYVNGTPQQGLVRFSRKAGAATRPPRFTSRPPARTVVAPTATVRPNGMVGVHFQSAWDEDSATLTYKLVRDKGTNVEKTVATTTMDTDFWKLPDGDMVDMEPTAGSHTYTIRVLDPEGNETWSTPSAAVSVAKTISLGSYAKGVIADGASHYWRLDETSGSAYDLVGSLTGTYGSGVTRGVAGALAGDTDTAARFNGTSSGNVATANATASGAMTLEAWVRSTSTAGGRFLTTTAASGSTITTDRHIYLTPDGRPGVRSGNANVPVVESTAKANDGKWHHVVATMATDGVTLYVDGQQVGRNATIALTPAVTGPWYLGGDRYGSGGGSTWSLAGDTDEAAVYPTALTAAQVLAHYNAGRGVAANAAPTAAFTATTSTTSVSVDASASTDADGTIASYAWDFGDGSSATGKTASHDYKVAGTFTVKLTVTDNAGATSSTTKTVTVAPAPDQPPVAAFTPTTSGRVLSVDGSASSDPDGQVASYAWDFGDGSTGAGVGATHTYAADGTYTVTLTVTDDRGATAKATKSVSVAAPAPPATPTPIASDAFGRTVTGGWGVADQGGAWNALGSSSSLSVSGGLGAFATAPGTAAGAAMMSVNNQDSDLTFTLSYDQAATGDGIFSQFVARGDWTNGLGAHVWMHPDGSVRLYAYQKVNGADTDVSNEYVVPGVSMKAGDAFRVRIQAVGSGTSTVRAKVWRVGTTEPTAWQVSGTSTAPAVQGPGGLALITYLAAGATTPSVSTRIDDLSLVTAP